MSRLWRAPVPSRPRAPEQLGGAEKWASRAGRMALAYRRHAPSGVGSQGGPAGVLDFQHEASRHNALYVDLPDTPQWAALVSVCGQGRAHEGWLALVEGLLRVGWGGLSLLSRHRDALPARRRSGSAGGNPAACPHPARPDAQAVSALRRERPVVEEWRRARAACDLEGNRAGLGCLEHLGNALSFAVVTEWPVRVYPRRRRWSPPHACLE